MPQTMLTGAVTFSPVLIRVLQAVLLKSKAALNIRIKQYLSN
ncbi:hypothetical protein [Clostridium sp. 'deep sea']|nr:hypothetical protein [Clostridium sp. 'deep sea']